MDPKALKISSILALLLGLSLAAKITYTKSGFDKAVTEARKTSEGYDKRFIEMVNRLEDVLAQRARFGYLGGKDPMTGKIRQVVEAPKPKRSGRKKVSRKVDTDPFKLTAIIYDDVHRMNTAIIMNKDRSFSVEVGDVVSGRKVLKITKSGLIMESGSHYYYYDINGNKKSRKK